MIQTCHLCTYTTKLQKFTTVINTGTAISAGQTMSKVANTSCQHQLPTPVAK